MTQPTLFDLTPDDRSDELPDAAARRFAVDPANDVVLEASAGTGKTRVLVDRYVRLVEGGVEPRNILAITFTRKAAAEMRERVMAELRRRAAAGAIPPARWRALTERAGDIQISTIDAFCFALLREFPLEADVDPAFDVADETEMARFASEAIDLTLRIVRGLLVEDETIRLLLARVKTPTLVAAIAGLLDRRHVALPAVAAFVGRGAGAATAAEAGARFVDGLRGIFVEGPERSALIDDGPHGTPGFHWLAADLARLDTFPADNPARVSELRRRLERHFLTKALTPRTRLSKPIVAGHFTSPAARKRHEQALAAVSGRVHEQIGRLDRDVNLLVARGLLRVLRIAAAEYETLLADSALMDFAAMLARAVALLSRQEEFARSRLKLQARYHHLLVDEFQDTSRLQWRLVELLIAAWGEGESAADAPTSIFIVGDRKQSIYRFRHAEVTLLDEAAKRIGELRPGRPVRQAITTSFRAVPELLAFVNALAGGLESGEHLAERFRYDETDRFPVGMVTRGARRDGEPVLGLVAASSMAESAEAVADEVARLIAGAVVRDRSGAPRPAQPDDIAILFRARAGHQYFEDALEARGIRTYVYKGLGFFDAPEVQDLQALLRYLAAPESDLRAAELLRSRIIRISDVGLARLAPSFAAALRPEGAPARDAALGALDREVLVRARESLAGWLAAADRVPASELIDRVLRESAYAFELGSRRRDQARENIKKVRALIRRVENRGYATLDRLARYFETLRAGDESNAIVEAAGAVSLMTMHAAKGLEFPIVFLVNLHLAGRGRPAGFSVIEQGPDGEPEVAFGSTDGTRLEDLRENEELRRLLYVAVTRARDRLYLAGEVDGNRGLKRGARSLAALLPGSLVDLFSVPSSSPDASEVVWTAGDMDFAFRVCRPPDAAPVSAGVRPAEAGERAVPPVLDVGARRIVPAAPPADPGARAATRRSRGQSPDDDRRIGAIVHRLLQRGANPAADDAALGAEAAALLSPEERVDVADLGQLVKTAAGVYRTFRQRPDVAALVDRGTCWYEVPFSYAPPARPEDLVRGVVDCLVIEGDGTATVLEFKTGDPRPEHEVQAAVYAEAMRAVFGLPDVRSRVLYA